jgi:hypothetical protein
VLYVIDLYKGIGGVKESICMQSENFCHIVIAGTGKKRKPCIY